VKTRTAYRLCLRSLTGATRGMVEAAGTESPQRISGGRRAGTHYDSDAVVNEIKLPKDGASVE